MYKEMTKAGVRPRIGTHANKQTFAHMADIEMHWELSRGPGGATQGRTCFQEHPEGRNAEQSPHTSPESGAKLSPRAPPSM